MSKRADLLARFSSRSYPKRQEAIARALEEHEADGLLAEMFQVAKFPDNISIAYLGDLHGESGLKALESAATSSGPRTRDLRCAALLALAKRCGETATPSLVAGLGSPDATVRDYAVVGLAGCGDDRAWDEVLDRLPRLLRRAKRGHPSEVLMAISYLAQHLRRGTDRGFRLVTLVRRHWDLLRGDEQTWFEEYFPAAAPNGPSEGEVDPPDADALRTWARTPLFHRLAPPPY